MSRGKHIGVTAWLCDKWEEYRHPGEIKEACVRDMGVTAKQVRDAYSRIVRKGNLQPTAGNTVEDDIAGDLIPSNEIFAKVDILGRVREFIADKLADKFIRDDRLRRRLKVSQSDWREIRQMDEFRDNIFVFLDADRLNRRTTVWGSKSMVSQARATVNMGRYES